MRIAHALTSFPTVIVDFIRVRPEAPEVNKAPLDPARKNHMGSHIQALQPHSPTTKNPLLCRVSICNRIVWFLNAKLSVYPGIRRRDVELEREPSIA